MFHTKSRAVLSEKLSMDNQDGTFRFAPNHICQTTRCTCLVSGNSPQIFHVVNIYAAKGVITKLGEDYDAFSRNCQMFSETLLLCIQRAHSQNEVFVGLSNLPYQYAAQVLKRRCKEWKSFKAERGLSALLHPPISPPLTVEAFLHVAAPPVLVSALVLAAIDLAFRGHTMVSLLCALFIGMSSPKANAAVLFYSAKSKALRNRILRK